MSLTLCLGALVKENRKRKAATEMLCGERTAAFHHRHRGIVKCPVVSWGGIASKKESTRMNLAIRLKVLTATERKDTPVKADYDQLVGIWSSGCRWKDFGRSQGSPSRVPSVVVARSVIAFLVPCRRVVLCNKILRRFSFHASCCGGW